MTRRIGLIAGNGRFPFLVLEAARSMGITVLVVAISEETFPEIEQHAQQVVWVGLGQLGKVIRTFKDHGITEAIMAGQVQHKQIFSASVPDWHMVRLLAGLTRKNTDSLIGAVAAYLSDQGIELLDSTEFLRPLLAAPGCLTRRSPDPEETADIAYGLPVAREIARLDVGQTLVVKDRAVIAVEAMEGTDAAIRRAAEICGRKGMSVVKVSKPRQDMRFDVPVIGTGTIRTMNESGATALSLDAGKTLLIEKDALLELADGCGITIVGQEV